MRRFFTRTKGQGTLLTSSSVLTLDKLLLDGTLKSVDSGLVILLGDELKEADMTEKRKRSSSAEEPRVPSSDTEIKLEFVGNKKTLKE